MKKLGRALLVMAIAALCAFLSYEALRVREINVIGLVERQAQEVRDVSGIQMGESLFVVDKKEVERSVNTSTYFVFESMKINWPSGVTISVRERVPVGVVEFGSYDLVIDDEGTVLETCLRGASDASLLRVNGVYVVSFGIGQQVNSSKPEQLTTLSNLLGGVSDYDYLDKLTEVNVASETEVRVTTTDGLIVKLGTTVQLERKLKWVSAALPELKQRYTAQQISGSELDVTTANSAVFALKGQ